MRWLRPELQRPSAVTATSLDLPDAAPEPAAPVALAPWPKTLSDRIAGVRTALGRAGVALSVDDVARGFKSAPRKDVAAILESLGALGLAYALATPEGTRWRSA